MAQIMLLREDQEEDPGIQDILENLQHSLLTQMMELVHTLLLALVIRVETHTTRLHMVEEAAELALLEKTGMVLMVQLVE